MDGQKQIISTEEESKKKKPSLTYYAFSGIVGFIQKLFSGSRLYSAAANGSKSYKRSFTGSRMFKKNSGQSGLRRSVTSFFSGSRVLSFFVGCKDIAASLSASVYAVFFLVYGLISALVTYMATIIDPNGGVGFFRIFSSVLTIVLSLPFLLTQKSLREMIAGSAIGRRVALSFLMIPEESLESKKRVATPAYMVLFGIVGFLLGACSYYFHPIIVPVAILGIFLFMIIMSFPEAGIMISAVAVPFLQYVDYSEEILAITVVTTSVSFLVKKYSGKRVSVRSARTVLLTLLCMFMLAASIFSAGGAETVIDAIYTVIILFGGFFVTYNLVKNEKRLEMCTHALVFSFGILVIAGLWDLIYNGFGAELISNSWSEISTVVSKRVFYIAESASTFGVVAALLCPLVFSGAVSKKNIIGVAFSLIMFVIAIATTFVFGTYESIVALLVGLLIYVILNSKRSCLALIVTVLCIAMAVLLFVTFAPDSMLNGAREIIESLIPTADPQSEIRDSVSASTRDMLLDGMLTGVGVGEEAFVRSFKNYSTVVSTSATNPGTLYLQILCWSGIGGLLCFAVFMLSVFGNAIGYIASSTDKKLRRRVLSLFCGVISVLLLGAVNAVWTDIRMFYLFWMCVALLCGYIRLGRENQEKKTLSYLSEDDGCDIEIRLRGR